MTITAILNGYNRPNNLPRIIEALKKQTIPPDEIMLWYNLGSQPPFQVDKTIKAAYCNYNFKFHGRFAFGLLAKSEYLAYFDDDTVPGYKWLENCMKTYTTHPGILGTSGVLLDSLDSYAPYTKIGWNGHHHHHITEVDLVGHAWFFKKEYLKYMWMEEPVSWENGEDIQFSYLAQKYGNIKTYVPPHPDSIPHATDVWGSVDGMILGTDSYATSGSETHTDIRSKIVKDVMAKGWKTVLMRKNAHG